jgi:hypothetical protein
MPGLGMVGAWHCVPDAVEVATPVEHQPPSLPLLLSTPGPSERLPSSILLLL